MIRFRLASYIESLQFRFNSSIQGRRRKQRDAQSPPQSAQVEVLEARQVLANTGLIVTTVDDVVDANDGVVSLREALELANNTAGADEITFGGSVFIDAVPDIIQLQLGELAITDSTTITGPGANLLTIDANHSSRVFTIRDTNALADVTLSGMTISNGNANVGGGIFVDDESLTLVDSVVSGNAATTDGGGIYGYGTNHSIHTLRSEISGNTAGGNGGGISVSFVSKELIIENSTISGNHASRDGGGIDADDPQILLISDSTISGNTSDRKGGGINADGFNMKVTLLRTQLTGNTSASDGGGMYVEDTGDTLTVQDSTISGNHAGDSGGGIYFYDPDHDVVVINSTVSGNSAVNKGGGIYLYSMDNGVFTIENSTVSGNTAAIGGGVYLYDPDLPTVIRSSTIANNTATGGHGGGLYIDRIEGQFDLTNTIISGNLANGLSNDLEVRSGTFNTLANNLIQTNVNATATTSTNNIFGVSALLLPLANNGGPTQTHALSAGSPAVDGGLVIPELPNDQRGVPRDSLPDIGAFEVGLPKLTGAGAITYVENDLATAIDSGITVTDPDTAALASATVTITNYVAGQDMLSFVNDNATMGDIAVLSNASGVLTLTSPGGSATQLQWQAALRAVKYANTSDNPNTVTRSVDFLVNDGSNDSNTLTSTISITATNDPAVIGGTKVGSVVEAGGVSNAIAGTPVATGTLTATDLDNPPNTFVAVAAGAASDQTYGTFGMTAGGTWTYTINNNNATVQALNAGGTLTDTFTVHSVDGTAQVVTITINGSNDSAVISGTSTGSVIEAGGVANGSLGTPTATGTLTDTDVDNPSNTFTAVAAGAASVQSYGTYGVTAGGVWTYTINNNNAAVQALNTGGVLTDSFTVNTVDGTAQIVTITIRGSNDAAVLTVPGNITYTEGDPATAIDAGIVVTDIDNATLARATVTITNFVAGQDILSFTSNSATMGNITATSNASGKLVLTSAGSTATVLQWREALRAVKYSNSSSSPNTTQRQVIFAINDGAGANDQPLPGSGLTSTINVVAANSAPTSLSLSSKRIAENNLANAVVGTLSAIDPDGGDRLSFSLASGAGSTDNASFSITGNQLRIIPRTDFETKASYSIRVRVTDQGGLSFDQVFTIDVTNVNEAPTNLILTGSSIQENNAPNAVVGTFSATDPDAGSTFTYRMDGGPGSADNAKFTIVGNTLQIKASADFETQSSYSIFVLAKDQAGLTFGKQFTIQVVNVNEAPTDITLPALNLSNNTADSTVGTLGAKDPDAGNTFTFALVSGPGSTDNSRFSIVGNSLKINTPLDYKTQSSYAIRIRVTDQSGLTFEKEFVITETKVKSSTDVSVIPRGARARR